MHVTKYQGLNFTIWTNKGFSGGIDSPALCPQVGIAGYEHASKRYNRYLNDEDAVCIFDPVALNLLQLGSEKWNTFQDQNQFFTRFRGSWSYQIAVPLRELESMYWICCYPLQNLEKRHRHRNQVHPLWAIARHNHDRRCLAFRVSPSSRWACSTKYE